MKEIVSQISPRERRLLYILLCFLIIVAGWFFVVTPSIDGYKEACVEYDTLVLEKISKDQELQRYIDAVDTLKEKKQSYSQIIDKYNPILSNEKIDKLLTTAFLAHGLKPMSLNISGVTDTNVSSTEKTSEKTATDTTQTTSSMMQATVNVTVNGTMSQFTKTVAYINKLKGVEIASAQIGDGSSNSSANISMTIIVYMVKK